MTTPKKVEVYWNLHKKCWSVRHKGTVIAHMGKVCLHGVQWVVQPAGRKRVLKEGKKNVHAFARGNLCIGDREADGSCTVPVTYNPYRYTTFIRSDKEEPITESEYALLSMTDEGRPLVTATEDYL